MARRRPASEPTPGSLADSSVDADPESVARAILLRRLTAAPRTHAELRDDLHHRGVPDEIADRVLRRFIEVGLIDDQAYAQMWVQSRHRSRGASTRLIGQELRRKGIDDEVVEHALAEVTPELERDRARALVDAKLPSTARLEPAARTRRLVGMLTRRGYSPSVAFGVVREALGDEADPLESA